MLDATKESKDNVQENGNIAQPQADIESGPTDVNQARLGNEATFDKIDFNPDFSFFSKTKKEAFNVRWKNLSYSVKSKPILKQIYGHVNAGKVCALMGPSGAGKTSLLNVLAGRIIPSKSKKISGSITVNGDEVSTVSFRRRIAYVLQHDFLYATATARESLEFSARLRLPKETTKAEREDLVNSLLEALSLKHVENTVVGSDMVRGLSGGEKKRVAIGVEIITNPSLLFLDEPTSGLDSYSAWKVVKILNCLAQTGAAVLCTIHQPSSEVFSCFDNVMMLSKGQVMYNGLVSEMASVLGTLGYHMPQYSNPADFAMLIAQTKTDLPCYNLDNPNDERQKLLNENISVMHQLSNHDGVSPIRMQKALLSVQIYELSKREMKNLGRDKGFLIANIGVTILMNLIFGIVFMDAANPNSAGYSIQSNFGAILIVFVSAVFGSAQGPLISFPEERGVMIREYQTGTYSSLVYLASKLMIELPLYFFRALLTIIVTYWLIGFNGSFIYYVLAAWLIQLVSASYAYTLGAVVSDAKQGIQFAPLLLVPQMLFAGVFVPIAAIPTWLQWVEYICILTYGVNIATLVEFGDCSQFEGINYGDCVSLLERNNVQADLLWLYLLVPVVLFIVLRSLSLVVLVLRARYFTG